MQSISKNRFPDEPSAFPMLMGVLNVSRDSFSDGGKYLDDSVAVEHAVRMVSEGAAIVDIGAESTRPNCKPLPADEELRLLLPKLAAVRNALPDVAISVDTYKPEVARAALENGADIINDVLVRVVDGRCPMAAVAAEFDCPIVATHNSRGAEISGDFFGAFVRGVADMVAAVEREGAEKIIIDPGFGFGKTAEQNFEIVARLGELRMFGYKILLGVSRKSSLVGLVGDGMDARDDATAAITAISAAANSADIYRVHDVAKNASALKTAMEISKWTKLK